MRTLHRQWTRRELGGRRKDVYSHILVDAVKEVRVGVQAAQVFDRLIERVDDVLRRACESRVQSVGEEDEREWEGRTVNDHPAFAVLLNAELGDEEDLRCGASALHEQSPEVARRVSTTVRTFFLLSPSFKTSPIIFSLCPHPYMLDVSQHVHPCPRTNTNPQHSLSRRTRNRDARSRSLCAE